MRVFNPAALTAAVTFTLALTPAHAQQVSLDEVWAIVQRQQTQITALTDALKDARTRLERTEAKLTITEEQLDITADYLADTQTTATPSRTTLGGYGELHYNDVNAGDDAGDVKEADFHRFVLFFGHEFTDRMHLASEFEIEHALLQDTADGRSSGEVGLEQAYIELEVNENHWTRAGVFLLPLGILNETHEPTTFFGVERNNVESIIIPSTWWEAGVAGGGGYANGISWDAAMHTGLQIPTGGSNAYRVRSGRQKVSNASAEDLAYTLRLKYTGVPGLEIAGSYHHQQDASQLAGDGLDSADLFSLHGIWRYGPIRLRALWAQWNFDGVAVELTGDDEQTGWYVEPSIRADLGGTQWGFYSRYEDIDGARERDRFDQWEVGFNFWPTDNVVLKFDYRNRDHHLANETGRNFHAIDVGVGYQF